MKKLLCLALLAIPTLMFAQTFTGVKDTPLPVKGPVVEESFVLKPTMSCTKTLYGSSPWTGYATQQAAYEGATAWIQSKTNIIADSQLAYEYPVDGYTYWRVQITYTAPKCYQ
jgi:hypothetical protein